MAIIPPLTALVAADVVAVVSRVFGAFADAATFGAARGDKGGGDDDDAASSPLQQQQQRQRRQAMQQQHPQQHHNSSSSSSSRSASAAAFFIGSRFFPRLSWRAWAGASSS
jgi:hypothetical protein